MRAMFKNPVSVSLSLLSRSAWYRSDLRTDFIDGIQTQHSQTQLHKGESVFFVKGRLMAPLVTACVSDDVAQEFQMPLGPQALEDVEEPLLSRPATLEDLGTLDQIVLDQHSMTHFRVIPGAKV